MIVAIDGPAGSGKSTLAKALAKTCHLSHLDTGAMYRSVTWKCIHNNIDLNDTDKVIDIAKSIDITFDATSGINKVFVDGVEVTSDIRTPEIDKNVSNVAKIPEVRSAMVERQRKLGETLDVVAEGRDIGTVVFPSADIKIFLVADDTARAKRRAIQQAGGDAATNNTVEVSDETTQEILDDMKRRDEIDSTRKVAPLKPAADAIHMDTSSLTVEEEVAQIAKMIAEKKSQLNFNKKTAEKQAVKKNKKKSCATTKMGMFGNRSDDYYDHSISCYPWHAKLAYWLMSVLVWLYTKILWPWKIEDFDKLHDASKNKGVVIVMNHGSMLDPLPIMLHMRYHNRNIRAVFKQEFADIAISRWFFSRIGGIPVARGTADLKCIRRCQRALQAGDSVLIFPEGTRVKAGEESHIHGGFALMAQLAGADVVPMAIVGARDITPRGKHLGKPGRVYMKVGDPISFDSLTSKKRKDKLSEMESVAMQQVFELRDELRREHPGKM